MGRVVMLDSGPIKLYASDRETAPVESEHWFVEESCSWLGELSVVANFRRQGSQYVHFFFFPFLSFSPCVSHLPCVYGAEQWRTSGRSLCVCCGICDCTLYILALPRGRKNDEEVLGW